ncbi:MAG: Crp/Fnr family transcriptional regulator [Thermoleophilia bacterium]|nr:Crp/Fnr family transcriptional regulator [Thermoleophilia bacterium]
MATGPEAHVDELRSTELFGDLGEDSLQRVSAVANELEAPAGAVLVNPDLPASGVFVVLSGTVVAETPDHREHELGAGECFGELALLAGTSRTGRVSARTPVRCLAIERTAFEGLLQDEPGVARALLRVLASRLIEAQASPRP